MGRVETGAQILAELNKTFVDIPLVDTPTFSAQVAKDFNGAPRAQKVAITHLRRAIRPSWRDVFWDSLTALKQPRPAATVYEYDPDNPFADLRQEVMKVFPKNVNTYFLLVEQAAAEFLMQSANNLKVKQVLLAGMGFVNSIFPNLPTPQIQNQTLAGLNP